MAGSCVRDGPTGHVTPRSTVAVDGRGGREEPYRSRPPPPARARNPLHRRALQLMTSRSAFSSEVVRPLD
ncbi:Hypothetical protein NTJ_06637 [Nesidiocoris tenuis]|uniref:Uncharacterized protein n=1 Tax=Nesidiocoris tenuis TaxID=355587 RepID=A0ABN7AP32_9HEMI|nr:Hypothetical protein NTJ_06637 [Nesidiocoris tenuis]